MLEDPQIRANARKFEFGPAATLAEIGECERRLRRALPAELGEFFRESCGGEGWIGGSFVMLYGPSEIADVDEQCSIQKFFPGALVFGRDGGGEYLAYAPTGRTCGIVVVPMIVLDPEAAVLVASNLRKLLLRTRPFL